MFFFFFLFFDRLSIDNSFSYILYILTESSYLYKYYVLLLLLSWFLSMSPAEIWGNINIFMIMIGKPYKGVFASADLLLKNIIFFRPLLKKLRRRSMKLECVINQLQYIQPCCSSQLQILPTSNQCTNIL